MSRYTGVTNTYNKEFLDKITPSITFNKVFRSGNFHYVANIYDEFYQLDSCTFSECIEYIRAYRNVLGTFSRGEAKAVETIADIFNAHKTDIINIKDFSNVPSIFRKYEVEALRESIREVLAGMDRRYNRIKRAEEVREGATKNLNYWKDDKIEKSMPEVRLEELFRDEINALDRIDNPDAEKPLLDNWEISLPRANKCIQDGDDLIVPYYNIYMGAWGTRSAGQHQHTCNYRLKNGYTIMKYAIKERHAKYIESNIKEQQDRLNGCNTDLHDYDFKYNPAENKLLNSLNILLNHTLPSMIAVYITDEIEQRDVRGCNSMAWAVEQALLRTMYMSPYNRQQRFIA